MITSLSDIQELLSAYNRKDYIQVGIKLIDLKMKINPPEANSDAEERLLRLKGFLVKIHPYYIKIYERILQTKQTIDTIRTTFGKTQADRIEKLINYLDVIENIIDTFIETLKKLLGDNAIETTSNEDENVSLEELTTLVSSYATTKATPTHVTERVVKQSTTAKCTKRTSTSTKRPTKYINNKVESLPKSTSNAKSRNKGSSTKKSSTKGKITTKKPSNTSSTQRRKS